MHNIEKECAKDKFDTNLILNYLSEFKSQLLEHLKLEDSEFYPQLEEKLVEQCEDPSDTISFSKKMLLISLFIKEFLNTYSTKEAIEKDVYRFRRDLVVMLGELSARMTSEDVFMNSEWRRCQHSG